MARRRRNPGGVIEWAKLHPWMTFFIVGSALAIPVQILQTRAIAKALAPPQDPLSKPTPAPVPSPVPPSLGGGTVFVPPACPAGQRPFIAADGAVSCIEVQT